MNNRAIKKAKCEPWAVRHRVLVTNATKSGQGRFCSKAHAIFNAVAGSRGHGRFICAVVLFVMQLMAITANAQEEKTIALVGATLHTIVGEPIENGVLLIEGTKIKAVGAEVAIPEDVEQVDLAGKHIYPGLIDADTAIGLVEIEAVRATVDSSETGQMNPNAEAIIAFNPDSELIPVARADGVLVALTAPRGGVIAGQSSVVQLAGWTSQDMLLRKSNGMHVNWPRASSRRRWFSDESAKEQLDARRKSKQRLKDNFDAARAYRALRDEDESAEFDPRLEAISKVTNDKMPLYVHADDVIQIQEAVAFCVKENLQLVIVGGYDAVECSGLLKKHDIPVIVTGTHKLPRHRHSAYDESYTLPARVKKAGLRFCLSGFDRFSASAVRNLPQHAGTAAAHGLSPEEAVRAITLDAAKIIGVADRVGSLEAGKDATIIATGGDVLEISTRVDRAWIAGQECDLDSRHKRLYRKYKSKYE